MDMARRENVPIYESIQDAVQAAIDKNIGWDAPNDLMTVIIYIIQDT